MQQVSPFHDLPPHCSYAPLQLRETDVVPGVLVVVTGADVVLVVVTGADVALVVVTGAEVAWVAVVVVRVVPAYFRHMVPASGLTASMPPGLVHTSHRAEEYSMP